MTQEQVAVEGWQPLLHPEGVGSYVARFLEALQQQSVFRAQARVRRHDGSWRWIDSHARPLVNPAGEFVGMAGSTSDVTEQKEFESELQRVVAERTAKLHELVGELEHFSYTITHDLKSPLRAMRGFAEMACLDRGRDKVFTQIPPWRSIRLPSRNSGDHSLFPTQQNALEHGRTRFAPVAIPKRRFLWCRDTAYR